MNILERKVENQVHFWSLLGPFLILLSTTVLLFKVSVHWYYPLSVLIGIPLCVKWKLQGMTGALCCLFLLSLVSYQNLELNERYWHVGMALAIAFSFIILTLSLEEVQGLIEKLQMESKSRLDNFLHLDEKLKQAEWEWDVEKSKCSAQINTLSANLTQLDEEKQTFYKLAQLAKDELIQVRQQHELLLQEFCYKKQQIAQLNERLEESELTVQNFVNSNPEKEINRLQEALELSEKDKATLKAQLDLVSNEKILLESKHEELNNRLNAKITELEEELSHWEMEGQEELNRLEQEYEKNIAQLQEKHDEFQSQLHQQYENEVKSFQQKVEGLELSLKEKSEEIMALESNNAELARVKEDLVKLQEKHDEFQSQLHQQYEDEVKSFQQKVEELELSLKEKSEEIMALESCKEELTRLKEDLFNQEKLAEMLPNRGGKNSRSIESMYVQLKKQFEEKANILEETRKQLFHTQEELLHAEKEYNEKTLYNISEGEKALQEEIVKISHFYEERHKEGQSEIDHLMMLVNELMTNETELNQDQ